MEHDNLLLKVCYVDVGTVDFMRDIVRTGCDYPLLIKDRHGLVRGGFLFVVILGFWRGQHRDNTDEKGVSTFFEACVMDGDRSVFRVRFNEDMHDYVAKTPEMYQVGTVVRISDYTLLWMENQSVYDWNVVMIAHSFCLHCGPQNSGHGSGEACVLPPHTRFDMISKKILGGVVQESVLTFLAEKTMRGTKYWSVLPWHLIKQGHFIPEGVHRARWLSSNRKRKEKQTESTMCVKCECQIRLGYLHCILDLFPLEDLDVDAVWRQARGWRVEETKKVDSFKALRAETKRWCVTKYYCATYFCIRLGSYKVPLCFTQKVGGMFPNPKGDFFKNHYQLRPSKMCARK